MFLLDNADKIFWYLLCSFDIINQGLLVMRKVILLFQSAYINLVCFIRDGKRKRRCDKKNANAHKKRVEKSGGCKNKKRKEKQIITKEKIHLKTYLFYHGPNFLFDTFPETSSDFNFSLGG